MIGLKIGGSSLKTLQSLDLIIRLLQQQTDKRRIIVLSALNGVTNHLMKSTAEALQTDRKISGLLDYLCTLHREWIINAIASPVLKNRVKDEIDYLLSRLEKLLYGIAYTGECTRRTRDLVASMGERLAVHLLAGYLTDRQIEAVGLEADKIGIVADGDFGNATANLPQTAEKLPLSVLPYVEKGVIPVITGFFWCDG
jgi:aspartate kinase